MHSFVIDLSIWGGMSDIRGHLFDSFVILYLVYVIFCMLLVIANKAYGTGNCLLYYVIDESIFDY